MLVFIWGLFCRPGRVAGIHRGGALVLIFRSGSPAIFLVSWMAIARALGTLTRRRLLKRNGVRFVAYRLPTHTFD